MQEKQVRYKMGFLINDPLNSAKTFWSFFQQALKDN
jgi:hypothetical protein